MKKQKDLINEWYTPERIIIKARNVFGGTIDVDPASNVIANVNIKANVYYTEEQNGLLHPWYGNVWLNPPFVGKKIIEKFIDKLTLDIQNIKQFIVYVDSRTDTAWFNKLLKMSDGLCFSIGRISCYKHVTRNTLLGTKQRFIEGTKPSCGQAIFYYGQNMNKFYNEFKDVGNVMMLYKSNLTSNTK